MTEKDKLWKGTIARLKKFKLQSGMGFEELSRKIGVSYFTVLRICQGKVKTPNQQTLVAIERFLDERKEA